MTYDSICPLDGRYSRKIGCLRSIFSEANYYKTCLIIEIKWLRRLAGCDQVKECSGPMPHVWKSLEEWVTDLNDTDIVEIKKIENEVKHDMKAVEIFLHQHISEIPEMRGTLDFVHFGLTSEDITNIAYALMMRDAKEFIEITIDTILSELAAFSTSWAGLPMLARTHGQAATPTTMGKEFENVRRRLENQYKALQEMKPKAKMNGATGNYAALHHAYPDVDWPELCCGFVNAQRLGFSTHTTQVEPHDWIAEWLHCIIRINNILVDFCKDIWHYMSLGYLSLKTDRVGSSTMPHKVNPIEFENAEGNFEMANNLMTFFADKLTKSRLQRDLSGSTVKRNLGMVFGYSQIGYLSLVSGLRKIAPNQEVIIRDLLSHPEVITEAAQTILRKYGVQDAYNFVKKHSNPYDQTKFMKAIYALDIPTEAKDSIRHLSPNQYYGLADRLA